MAGEVDHVLDQLVPAGKRMKTVADDVGTDVMPCAGGDFLDLELEDFRMGSGEKVAEVEMPVPVFLFGGIFRHPVGVDVKGEVAFCQGVWCDGDAGFLKYLAGGAGRESGVFLEVAAGLEMAAEGLVDDEQDPGVRRVEDDGAGGDMAVEIFPAEEVVVGGEKADEIPKAVFFPGMLEKVGVDDFEDS